MTWLWIGLSVVLIAALLFALGLVALYVYLRCRYLENIVRIFQETPLFIPPGGQSVEKAEDVYFQTADALRLHGRYFKTTLHPRRGVILLVVAAHSAHSTSSRSEYGRAD